MSVVRRLAVAALFALAGLSAKAQTGLDSLQGDENFRRLQQRFEAQLQQRRRSAVPPPMAPELYAAYEFRYQLLGNPECLRYAQEADTVLMNGKLTDKEKVAPLGAVEAAARAAGCVRH